MSIDPITAYHARFIIAYYCHQYAANEPANITPIDAERAIEDLTRQLSWYVGKTLNSTIIGDIITTIDELDSIDAETHPDIELNETRTIDNRDELRERLDMRLDDEISDALVGWHPRKETFEEYAKRVTGAAA
jgi:hypothetical protein